MAEPAFANSLSRPEDPQAEYRTVEPWAIAGVLLGLLAAVAMLGGVLWLVAALGVVTNLVALARIRRDEHRSGRGAALLGLALSVAFAVAPLAQSAAAWWLLTRQARPVAEQFLRFLGEDSPEKAMGLRFTPDRRLPFDDQLWTYFRHDGEAGDRLKAFVADPAVRTLLALGARADVRFYKTAAVVTEGSRGVVSLYYTVTYSDDDDEKTTFFVNVILERKPTDQPDVNPWRVMDITGGFDPDDLTGRRNAEKAAARGVAVP